MNFFQSTKSKYNPNLKKEILFCFSWGGGGGARGSEV